MKRTWAVLGIATAVSLGAAVQAQGDEAKPTTAAMFASADKAEFKEKMPGLGMAIVWGDPDKGAYGTYVKMAPGFDAGMHTHTNDVWLLVIKGAYLYKDDAGEKRVGPGDVVWVPAGLKHWSGSDPKDGAVFYQGGTAAFDLVPAK